MPYSIRLPDGTLVQNIPDDVPFSQARARIEKMRPDLAKFAEERQGFMPAAKAGVERLKGEAGLVAGKLGLMSLKEAEAYKKEKEEQAARIHTPTEKGWSEAPFTKFKETLGGSLPYMAAPAAAGLATMALPVTGAAAGLAAAGAAGAVSAGQFTGSNLARQMETGKSLEEASLGKAVAAAIPQAAIDTVAGRMLPGIGRVFGAAGVKVTAETAEQIAKQSMMRVAGDYVAATGKAVTTEGLTEAAQQVLERLQAGLKIADPEARKEYFDSFIGGAVLGGAIAPAGRYMERAKIAAGPEKPVEPPAAEAEAEEAPPTEPQAPAKPLDEMTYEELVQLRERLRQEPSSKERAAKLKEIRAELLKSNEEFTKREQANRAKAAESAFGVTEPQQMEIRETLDTELQGQAPAAAPETEIEEQSAPSPQPGQGELFPEEAVILASELDRMGNLTKPMKRWLMDNVVGKTVAQVQEILDSGIDPATGSELKGYRKTLLPEIIAAQTPVEPYAERAAQPEAEEEPTFTEQRDETVGGEPQVEPTGFAGMPREELVARLETLEAEQQELAKTKPPARPRKGEKAQAKWDAEYGEAFAQWDAADAPYREAISNARQELLNPTTVTTAPETETAVEGEAAPKYLFRDQYPTSRITQADFDTAAQQWNEEKLEEWPDFSTLSAENQIDWIQGDKSAADADFIVEEHQREQQSVAEEAAQAEATPRPEGALPEAAETAVRNNDMAGALDAVAAESKVPLYSAVAKRLRELMTGTPVSVGVSDLSAEGARGRATTSNEGFAIDLDERAGLNEVDLLHEGVHIAVDRVLAADPKTLTEQQRQAKAELTALHKRVGLVPKLQKKYKTQLMSLNEFVAYGMTDAEFQKDLATVKYTPETTLWDTFKSTILKLLGIKTPTTAKEAVIGAGEALFSTPSSYRGQAIKSYATAPRGTAYAVDPELMARAQRTMQEPKSVKEMARDSANIVKGVFTDPVGTATAIRTTIADRWATVEQRLQRGVDGVRKAGSQRAAGVVIARQAEDLNKLIPSFLYNGKLVVDDLTKLLKVERLRDKNGNPVAPVQLYEVLGRLAKKLNLTEQEASAYASTVMEGRRLQALITEAKTNPDIEVQIHWRKDDKSIDYAKIKQASQIYDSTPEFKELADIMDAPRKSLMNELIKAGWIDKETGETMRDVAYYVPFDRMTDEQLAAFGESFKKNFRDSKKRGVRGIAHVGRMPELKGAFDRPVGNVFDNYFKTLTWLSTELAKQNATSQIMKDMTELGYARYLGQNRAKAKTDYVVTNFIDGVPHYYELPSQYDYVAFLDRSPPKGWFVRNMSNVAGLLRTAITANPVFAASQVVQDIQGALLLADVKNPARFVRQALGNFASLTWHELKNIPKYAKGKRAHHHAIEKFMADRGLTGEVDYTVSNPALDIQYSLGLQKRRALGSTTVGAILHGFKQITNASDLAVRKALYDDAMRVTHDEMLAGTKARELINFRRRGANGLVRDMTAMVPFFNAHIQSMDILWREATGQGSSITGLNRKQAKLKLMKMMGLYAGFATIYAMMRNGDDDYDNMDERTKNGNWLFPGEDGGIRIPIRRDLSTIKVAIENAVDWYKRQGTSEERLAKEAVATTLVYALETYASGYMPIPAALKPLIENMTNYSFLTGRELVGTYQKGLDKHLQETSATSEASKGIARFLKDTFDVEMSPILLDNALRGYFGTTGATVAGLTDMMLNPDSPDRPLHKMMAVGAFAWDKTQLTAEKGEFYDLAEKVLTAKRSFDSVKDTNPDYADKLLEEYETEISLAPIVNSTLEQLSDLRKAIKVYKSPATKEYMSREEIQTALDAALEEERMIVDYIRELRAETGL